MLEIGTPFSPAGKKALLLGSGELTDWQAGDLVEDGQINAFDMVMMRRLILAR